PMLRGLIAQRLVRRICSDCARPRDVTHAEAAMVNGQLAVGETMLAGNGCAACDGTGFRGRVALYDLVRVTPDIEAMIAEGATEADLNAAAQRQSPGLLGDGIAKIRQGLTVPAEVARVILDPGTSPLP
ncbi:MAG: type II secretion system protein GspE, partial [Pseudomonadota bacterium]